MATASGVFLFACGTDSESHDGTVAAETFASVDPRNNRKLAADVEKVKRTNATYKYVFYFSPKNEASEPAAWPLAEGVRIVSLEWHRG